MNHRSVTNFIDRIPAWSYFLLLFTYLVLLTFQGIDMADEGFNSIFFQQIYNDPGTVQYSFMFWLAGVVGGAFEYLFPDLGFWGFRFLGAITITATLIITYNLLKEHLRKSYLMIGLALALLIISNNVRVFHYNYLCTFWFMVTASLLFNGLRKNSLVRIFLAGGIVTLEVFTRIPSLVNAGLVLTIFYYAWITKATWGQAIKQALVFIAGFITFLLLILLIMKVTGHLAIFLGALDLVVQMGKGGEGSHYGLSKLIWQFFYIHGLALKVSILVLATVITLVIASNYARTQSLYRKWMGNAVGLFVVAVFIVLIVTDRFNHLSTLYLLTDISLIAGVFVLAVSKSVPIRTLMFIGCYIILTYPLGSSDGMVTVGIYTLWLALPIAVHYLCSITTIESNSVIRGIHHQLTGIFRADQQQLRTLRNYTFGLLFFACLYQAYYYPFFDHNDRRKMTYRINNKYMKGIFVSESRAKVINDLLAESAKYIHPGDRVLAYHSIPMFHYMTESKPFLRNSMPWLYEGSFFRKELNETAMAKDTLPVIVRQLVKTVGDASNWPDPPADFDENWAIVNEKRDKALDEFVAAHGYQQVWKNTVFAIYIPPSMQSTVPAKP